MTIRRRNWLLQQLGITQWKLRHPAILQGTVKITLPTHIRLLLVSDPPLPVDHPLVTDVARSMALTPAQLYGVTPEQVMMLSGSIFCHCWWLGLEVMRDFDGMSFHTPSLAVLLGDAGAKRELWRRISNDKYYITTTAD